MDLVQITEQAIEIAPLMAKLHEADDGQGAIVTFSGRVRGRTDGVSALFLEHYPAMTEKSLRQIVADARQRWSLGHVCVIHRVGEMRPGDTIVFVAATSAHRRSAFEAAQYLMDRLKTEAPFWKKEKRGEQWHWVAAKKSDQALRSRWDKPTNQ
ncbi:MAG: molybdopterin synthase catalytic subunit MoaE [Gammaproteobacteria bacterium]|nr:MAG: molybdopterin synthase catalytic subunit MoaE [Gammaproteobacteria bacterium]